MNTEFSKFIKMLYAFLRYRMTRTKNIKLIWVLDTEETRFLELSNRHLLRVKIFLRAGHEKRKMNKDVNAPYLQRIRDIFAVVKTLQNTNSLVDSEREDKWEIGVGEESHIGLVTGILKKMTQTYIFSCEIILLKFTLLTGFKVKHLKMM